MLRKFLCGEDRVQRTKHEADGRCLVPELFMAAR